MECIRAWVWQIVGIIILNSVCEMLVPHGDIKKYVSLVIGLILVINVVKPIVDIPSISFDEIKLSAQKQSLTEFKNTLGEKERFDVIMVYKEKVCDKLQEELKRSLDVDAYIKLDAEEKDEKKIGEIRGVTVIIQSETGQSDKIQQIKKIVVEMLGIREENVKIHIMKKSGETKYDLENVKKE